MTVWAVHPVRDNLGAVIQYGQLRYINSHYVYADLLIEGDRIPDGFMNNMLNAVRDFNPADDYLLIAGDHLQLLQMSALLADLYQSFRVLRFDRIAQGYYPVTIEV